MKDINAVIIATVSQEPVLLADGLYTDLASLDTAVKRSQDRRTATAAVISLTTDILLD